MALSVFIIGPAGSGKTTFTANFAEWARSEAVPVLLVNLDPAAEQLPYVPDVDVREYIDARSVMESFELGPNGAIIASMDMLLGYLERLREEIEPFKEGYVLVDTPGQMELFVFRRSGEAILRLLTQDRAAVVFLMDATLSTSPSSFLSQVFLAVSVLCRIKLPQINALNKADLLSTKELERILRWCDDPDSFECDLEMELKGIERLAGKGLLNFVKDFMDTFDFYVISSKNMEGFSNIYSELQKIYMGGEDFELPEYLSDRYF